jgi:hypothetical protein
MFNWLKIKQRFLDWMKIRGDYDRYPDSYALSQQGIESHLLEAIKFRQARDQAILLVTHFPATFDRLQGLLENAGYDFEIAPLKFGPDYLLHLIDKATPGSPPLLLVLAPTFDDSSLDRPLPPNRKLNVSFMVLERHPALAEDQRIDQFARVWPFSVRIGYLLSMDDPVVKYCIHPTIIEMLKQMGLGDQELITSNMVTRQLERILKKFNLPARSSDSARTLAEDSAEEWLKQLPPPAHQTNK